MPPGRLCSAHDSGACVDNLNSTAAAVEMHVPVDQRVQRKIAPLADPFARMKAVADLADEDVSGSNFFAAESLHAEALRVGVTTVTARALSFFMCHGNHLSAKTAPRADRAGGNEMLY